MLIADLVERHIAQLRRYARALLGNTVLGDHQVELVLVSLMDQNATPETKSDLFTKLDRALRTHVQDADEMASRRALLLTAMEEFTISETSQIMDLSRDEVRSLLQEAERKLVSQLSARLMIIEDEPLIAAHLEEISQSIGHKVVAKAATKTEALAHYSTHKPDLILTDIQLADNSLGTDAITEMQLPDDVPVIFITAFPEQMLSNQGIGPAYLITKPFNIDYLKAVISQALMNVRHKKG